jgi:tetratricopeptide (TPR) repeat protein
MVGDDLPAPRPDAEATQASFWESLGSGDLERIRRATEAMRAHYDDVVIGEALMQGGKLELAASLVTPAAAASAAFTHKWPSHMLFPLLEADQLRARGDSQGARRILEAMRAGPYVSQRSAALLLLGKDCFDAGEYACAASAIHETLGRDLVMPGAYRGGLYRLAVSSEQLGNVDEARRHARDLLRLLAGADPDFPDLVKAKELAARLGVR